MEPTSHVKTMIHLFEEWHTIRTTPSSDDFMEDSTCTSESSGSPAKPISPVLTEIEIDDNQLIPESPPRTPTPSHPTNISSNKLTSMRRTRQRTTHLKNGTLVSHGLPPPMPKSKPKPKPKQILKQCTVPTNRLRNYTRALTAQNAELKALRDKLLMMSSERDLVLKRENKSVSYR